MRKTIIRTGLIAAIFAILSIGLVAPTTAAPAGVKISFAALFVSESTTLNTLPGGHTYGWNKLNSPTKIDGKAGNAQFLGSVNYLNGSGQFGGLITVTLENGSILAMEVDGNALSLAKKARTGDTRFSGSVQVISGTGDFKNAIGIGTMTGTRAAALGSPVAIKINLTLK